MRFSVILLAAGLIGCNTPVTTQAWGDNTIRLASALELSGATLQEQARVHFSPDSAELLSVNLTGRRVENEFARQVIAWKALDAYASDVQRVLEGREMESERVKQSARAFHDLHRHLLQSGIAEKLGLTVEMHRATVQEILATKSMVSALEAAQPAINILCAHLAAECQQLEQELDNWLDTCLRQIDSKWHSSLNGYAILLARKRNLETMLAAQSAGAAKREGDPSGELLKVETLIRNSEAWRALYAKEQESVALAFRDARSHVQKTSHAVLEWGIAHREITKAMRSDSGFANIRLLEASADELAPASFE